jgi:hypothetical protein
VVFTWELKTSTSMAQMSTPSSIKSKTLSIPTTLLHISTAFTNSSYVTLHKIALLQYT